MAVAWADVAVCDVPKRFHEGRRRVAGRLAPVDKPLAFQDHCWGRADRRHRLPRVLLPQDRVERVAVAQSLRAGHAARQRRDPIVAKIGDERVGDDFEPAGSSCRRRRLDGRDRDLCARAHEGVP